MSMPRRAVPLTVCLLLWAQLVIAAQTPPPPGPHDFIVKSWSTDDGLPQNSVLSIRQTRDGYLWLGTLIGLVRFDGLSFEVFDESNTPGLNNSRIVYLFEDSKTNFWIGTESAGVALVQNGQVRTLPLGGGGREGRLVAACEDALGAVWLYTANGQLCRYQQGTTNLFSIGPDRSGAYRTLCLDSTGVLRITTDRRILSGKTIPNAAGEFLFEQEARFGRLDYLLASERGGYWRLADNSIQKVRSNQVERNLGSYPWSRAPVAAACEDHQGNLLVGTLGEGVFWFDNDGGFTRISTEQGLSQNDVVSLQFDREGTLWVGTDGGGLNQVKPALFDLLEGTRNIVVQSTCPDPEGGLWIGSNGGGVYHWSEGTLRNFGATNGLHNLYVRSVFVDQQQRVWAGTWNGLFSFRNDQFFRAAGPEAIHPIITAIHQDRHSQLWIGTEGGLVRWDEENWKVFTTRDGLSSDAIRALADDPQGNLWIGTSGGGLNRFTQGSFTVFHEADGLPSEEISCLWTDTSGTLWIGTYANGLARFQDGRFTRFTTEHGLISNSVAYLIEDGLGNLWIGSNAGLMRAPLKAFAEIASGRAQFITFRAYDKANGLPTRECTAGSQPAPSRSAAGKFWFPTIKGLVSVDPAQVDAQANRIPPPVVVEALLIDNQPQIGKALRVPPPSTLVIPADKERLEIHYTSLNLAGADRARFRYQLHGHENTWTEAGNGRIARYSKLPPRQYRFQVIAANEDGIWNDTGAVLAIIVEPPFWRTWWFLTLMTASLLAVIVAVVHYLSTQRLQRQVETLQQQEALEKERSRIARDLHDQLGASLTQIAMLSEMAEAEKDAPADVEAHAQQISQTARDTTRVLDEIVWAVNPSNDTLDSLITYLCKYAQDYLTLAGLRYRLEIPPQLPNRTLPPDVRHNVFLACKEALTNVLRHAHASEVRLRLLFDPAGFTLEIEDNGRGMNLDPVRAKTRHGLGNMEKRMEDIRGRFAAVPAPDGGTIVRLRVPLLSRP